MKNRVDISTHKDDISEIFSWRMSEKIKYLVVWRRQEEWSLKYLMREALEINSGFLTLFNLDTFYQNMFLKMWVHKIRVWLYLSLSFHRIPWEACYKTHFHKVSPKPFDKYTINSLVTLTHHFKLNPACQPVWITIMGCEGWGNYLPNLFKSTSTHFQSRWKL